MKLGRPTQYTPELVQKVYDYVNACVDTVEEFHKTRGQNSDSYERILNVKLPSIEGLACHLMFSKDTIYTWAKEEGKEDFSDALEYLKVKQGEILLNNGLSAGYNPTIAKMLLASHGYVEKTENKTDITSNGQVVTGFQIIDASNPLTPSNNDNTVNGASSKIERAQKED